MNDKLKKLQKKIGIKFKNKKLLNQALIHRSYLNETKNKNLKSNERLEFLGDAVLEHWTTKELFNSFPDLPEGILTNLRAAIVCTNSLAEAAADISLGDYLYLSKGEQKSGGGTNPTLLADAFEALIGAIYIDQGQKKTFNFLDRKFGKKLQELGKKGNIKDNKTLLQEVIQERLKLTPKYEILTEEGPDHDKLFTTAVFFNNKQIAKGKGKSKQKAEETAAEKALTKVNKKGKI